jgi:hypothetical protein
MVERQSLPVERLGQPRDAGFHVHAVFVSGRTKRSRVPQRTIARRAKRRRDGTSNSVERCSGTSRRACSLWATAE